VIAEIHHGEAPAEPVRWHNELALDRTAELLDQAVEVLEGEDLDAIVLLGDLSNLADDASLAHVAQTVAATGRPVYVVPGNHDIDGHPKAVERFRRPLSLSGMVVAPAVVEPDTGIAVALVGLRRDAATNALSSAGHPFVTNVMSTPLLVLTHFPLLAMSERLANAGLRHAGDLADRDALCHAVSQFEGPVISVHGHLHVRASEVHGSMLHLSCAALVEPPHEVTLLTIETGVDGHRAVSRRARAVGTSGDMLLPVLSPASERWVWDRNTWVQALAIE
jgi:Icc-related predicted phosphoesterase